MARENGIRTLLELGGLRRLAEIPRKEKSFGSEGEDEEDDVEAAASGAYERKEEDPLRPHEAEALRCLCNVLMLHPSARDVFPNVILSEDQRTAMRGMVRILGCEGAGFLGGRLLFMLTSKPSEAVAELVLDEGVVDVLAEVSSILSCNADDSHKLTLEHLCSTRIDTFQSQNLLLSPLDSPLDRCRNRRTCFENTSS